MRYISIFSGIEAATVAWKPLGWEAVALAEIEKFPCAVLKHRFPGIPNLGDMTKVRWRRYRGKVDLVCGGPPCQDYSIAGKRKSLGGIRGRLTLSYVEAIHAIRPIWNLTENVPGWLNTPDNAFGAFLAGLIGAKAPLEPPGEGSGWPGAGIADGPTYGAAWRTLDAQYFGVPQRRRRVFVIGYLGDWRRAAQVLFEPEGLPGDTKKSRKKRQDVAPTISARTKGGGGLGTDFDLDDGLVTAPLTTKPFADNDGQEDKLIVHTLKGEGFDASEDGTGRGTPIIPIIDGRSGHGNQHGLGVGKDGDPSNTLDTTGSQAIAFSSKDDGGDVGEISPTLRAENSDKSNQNAGSPPAVVYDMRGNGDGEKVPNLTGDHASRPTDYTPMIFEPRFVRNDRGAPEKICPPLKAQSGQTGKGDAAPVVFQQNSRSEVRLIGGDGETTGSVTSEPGAQQQNYAKIGMTVRRLTPRECERLQDFEDDHTKIPWRGKPADKCPDGPRYKATGNSWVACCAVWIGKRIELVNTLKEKLR